MAKDKRPPVRRASVKKKLQIFVKKPSFFKKK